MLALFGPTATGKSTVAHALALALGGEVVVADPFQRYRGLEIASDAPDDAEMAQVRYHLVRDLELHEDSTAGEFAESSHAVIDALLDAGRLPIVAGGTGLYVRAALCDLQMRPAPPDDVRAWAEALGADPPRARAELARLDPAAVDAVDTANPRRLVRALERAATGDAGAPGDIWSAPPRHPTLVVGLDRPRDVLVSLIAQRVQRELDDGLVGELEAAAVHAGLARGPQQVIGMREVRALQDGEMSPDALPEALAARTRRLARMQRTWMRRMAPDAVIDLGDRPAADGVPEVLALWRRCLEGVG